MLANQKVRGSILGQGSIFFLYLYEFTGVSTENNKGKHEFKTQEVHEKWS